MGKRNEERIVGREECNESNDAWKKGLQEGEEPTGAKRNNVITCGSWVTSLETTILAVLTSPPVWPIDLFPHGSRLFLFYI